MPLTFGNLTAGAAAILIGSSPPPAAASISTAVRAAWVAFAASGDPGWPAYDDLEQQTWVIDSEPVARRYPEEASRLLWVDHAFAPLDLAGP